MIQHFLKSYQTDFMNAIQELDQDQISRVVEVLLTAHQQKKKIMIAGNGGSASTASHFACDLAKTALVPGLPAFRVISLSDNIPIITAYGNDIGYEHIFSEQVAAMGDPGDVLIGISGSGNSPNILRAFQAARDHGVITLGLLGFGGGEALALCDVAVVLTSKSYGPLEDIHMHLTHAITDCIKNMLTFDRQFEAVFTKTVTKQVAG